MLYSLFCLVVHGTPLRVRDGEIVECLIVCVKKKGIEKYEKNVYYVIVEA